MQLDCNPIQLQFAKSLTEITKREVFSIIVKKTETDS